VGDELLANVRHSLSAVDKSPDWRHIDTQQMLYNRDTKLFGYLLLHVVSQGFCSRGVGAFAISCDVLFVYGVISRVQLRGWLRVWGRLETVAARTLGSVG